MASISATPRFCAAATTCLASLAFLVNAFSTSTCLPASIASSARAACSLCGDAT